MSTTYRFVWVVMAWFLASSFAMSAPAYAEDLVLDTETYTLRVSAPSSKIGHNGRATVAIVPKKGWKLNKDFPTQLVVEPPQGVKVTKKELRKKDAKSFSPQAGATWWVAYKSWVAGKNTFSANIKFAVCSDATCDPQKQRFTWGVDVVE